jgi:hypothetical protein
MATVLIGDMRIEEDNFIAVAGVYLSGFASAAAGVKALAVGRRSRSLAARGSNRQF